ncbi:MAG: hypothetical protein SOZ34_02725 [Clostridia bacterium]|nr:hypothetical protein [Clostridia bacterium]
MIEKKLWPTGYNFFSNIENLHISKLYENIVSYFTDDGKYETQVLTPEKILINTGDQTTRISISSNDGAFEEISAQANEILKEAFSVSGEKIDRVKKEELYSVLSARSVYLSYGRNYSLQLFNELLGNSDSLAKLTECEFSDVVISYSSSITKSSVYIADFDNDDYYRFNITKSTDKLSSLCDDRVQKSSQNGENVINYSFDLKFDQPFGVQKTTLNPLIQIYSTTPQMPVVEAVNPITEGEEDINETIIDNILRVFNINASTMRRYTEEGGTMVFVENNGVLKIDRSGFLEYTAIDSGIELSSDGREYSNIINTAAIAAKINKAIGNNDAMCLSQSENDGTLTFDYMASGTKVVVASGKISAGAEAQIENGELKSYRQLIRRYSVKSDMSAPSEFLTALDNAIAKYSEFMNEINIEKMFIAYTDNGSDADLYADWVVKVDNVVAGE